MLAGDQLGTICSTESIPEGITTVSAGMLRRLFLLLKLGGLLTVRTNWGLYAEEFVCALNTAGFRARPID